MAYVNHVNLTDSEGRVYCRKRNSVVTLDETQSTNYCAKCPMFAGSAQGEGVECRWSDPRKDLDGVHVVIDPNLEKDQVKIADILNDDKDRLVVDK
ncbi:hypothetical protein D3C74_50630 [compost metagenome]